MSTLVIVSAKSSDEDAVTRNMFEQMLATGSWSACGLKPRSCPALLGDVHEGSTWPWKSTVTGMLQHDDDDYASGSSGANASSRINGHKMLTALTPSSRTSRGLSRPWIASGHRVCQANLTNPRSWFLDNQPVPAELNGDRGRVVRCRKGVEDCTIEEIQNEIAVWKPECAKPFTF
eukprot:705784-Rhodomonas_salina.1